MARRAACYSNKNTAPPLLLTRRIGAETVRVTRTGCVSRGLCVAPPNGTIAYLSRRNDSATRATAGCFQFFTNGGSARAVV